MQMWQQLSLRLSPEVFLELDASHLLPFSPPALSWPRCDQPPLQVVASQAAALASRSAVGSDEEWRTLWNFGTSELYSFAPKCELTLTSSASVALITLRAQEMWGSRVGNWTKTEQCVPRFTAFQL